jgi:hypothetical protein
VTAVAARARRVVVCGVAWGFLTSILQWVTLPLVGTWRDGILLLLSILPGWCVVGAGLAAWIEVARHRLLAPTFLVISTLGCASVLSAAWSFLYGLPQVTSPESAMGALFPNGTDAFASYLYQAWVIVFYGGLYFFLWTLNYRAERTRQLLNDAHLARMHAETILAEAQITALREYVDPQFLLRVVTEAERRYASHTTSADQLIGRLVSFLRLAMPGVRTGRSSLTTELALARAHVALTADVERRVAIWTVTAQPALPDVALPPFIFVLLLEGATAAAPDTEARLDASREGDRVVISVSAPACGDCLTPDRAYRLRVGLSTLYGTDWSLEFGGGPSPVPLLRLSIRTPQFQPKETVDA